MSIKKKFMISTILMLVIPLVLIVVISFFFLLSLSAKYPWFQPVELWHRVFENADIIRLVVLWVLLALAVAIGTSVTITAYLSRSIVRPLRELREGADKIKQGNLDFEIIGSDSEEVQDLCRAFDSMRLRLKESVAQERAYEAERNQLMANIAHDLKTPLTSIKGYVEGIMDGVANTPEKMEKYLSTILLKSQNMEEILENLSLYSKLELGKIRYHFEYIDIMEFLAQTLDAFTLDIQQADMALDTRLEEEPVLIKGDREKLRRVFANIISNAVKYRNRGADSRLTVRTERNERGISVEFSDNGIGISSKDITKVFEGFYRSDPSRNTQVKGSGLGLAITKQIVEDHGGKVWLRSEENQGTQVVVYLPYARREAEL